MKGERDIRFDFNSEDELRLKLEREYNPKFEFNDNAKLLTEAIEEHIQPLQLNEKLYFIAEQLKYIHSQADVEYYSYVFKGFSFGIIAYYHKEVSPIINKKKRMFFCYVERDRIASYLSSMKQALELKFALRDTDKNDNDDNDFQKYEFGYIKNGTLYWTADNMQFCIAFFQIAERFNFDNYSGYSLSKRVQDFEQKGLLKFSKNFNLATFKTYFEKLNDKNNPYIERTDIPTAKEVLIKSLINK